MRSLVIITLALFLPGLGHSNNQPPAQTTLCSTCHGLNGISNNPLWPNLAGQKKDYLIKQIKDFKSKQRHDPLMSPIAETISPQDIGIISEYFSKLKN